MAMVHVDSSSHDTGGLKSKFVDLV